MKVYGCNILYVSKIILLIICIFSFDIYQQNCANTILFRRDPTYCSKTTINAHYLQCSTVSVTVRKVCIALVTLVIKLT